MPTDYARLVRSRVRELIVPLVVGVPITAVAIAMVVMATSGARTVGLVTGIALALVAWFVLRAAPLWSFALVCVAFAIQAAFSGLFLTVPSAIVFPIVVYGATARTRREMVPLVMAGGVIGAGFAAWRFTGDPALHAAGMQPSPVAVTIALLAVVAAAVSLGLLRRTQLANVALLTERARLAEGERDAGHIRAIRDERQRIAREMHDVVSHSLSVMVNLARGGRYITDDPDRAAQVLTTIEETGRQALTDMRGLVEVLRPDHEANPDRADATPALESPQPGLRQLPELIDRTRAAGLAVDLALSGAPRMLSPSAELAAFRVVQEALTNVAKHAGPAAVATVALSWERHGLTIRVLNGPASTATAADSSPGGYGLIGMRERLHAVGGSVEAGPAPDGGFTVVADIPALQAPREGEAR